MFVKNKNIMENIVETLFAKDNSKPEAECKTCKNTFFSKWGIKYCSDKILMSYR